MKPCPFCAELIQEQAVKCRFCGSVLDPASRPAATALDEWSSLPWGKISAAVAVVVVLGVVLGFALRDRSPAATDPAAGAAAAAQPRFNTAYRFAEMPWGTTTNEVEARLRAQGFTFTERDDEGDYVFSGTLEGRPAVVIAMFARETLAKIIVVRMAEGETDAVYAATLEALGRQFGKPGPQEAGRSGSRVTAWPPNGATGERMWVTVTDTGDVAVHYESGRWVEEHGRSSTENREPKTEN